MGSFQQLCENFGKIDGKDLGYTQSEQLRRELREVAPDEIRSPEDGKTYVHLLRKFREALAAWDQLKGENYSDLLHQLLSVGEDGVYSDPLHFMYELIQNVDDCDYADLNDCALDMRFDFNTNQIILNYNEIGFTPFNVFAITGIAEAAKNISASKVEIGEKGIGFKSVFGVADKVWIHSGWFSFELYKKNFTVPVAIEENAEYYSGTELTLFLHGSARELYDRFKKEFCSKEALFSRNPLLFLNKLTSLTIYNDCWRKMEFLVPRTPAAETMELRFEPDIPVTVSLQDSDSGQDKRIEERIRCARYSLPVMFSRKSCQSRYGEKTAVGSNGGKRMQLQIVLPYPEEIEKVGDGALYSFLPTKVRLAAKLACNVPYKLDASREHVDPQDPTRTMGNLWFQEASSALSEMLEKVYLDWSRIVGESIVFYIPAMDENLFCKDTGNELCLSRQEQLQGKRFLSLPLFRTIDGSYAAGREIFYFPENPKEPERVCQWLSFGKKLFLPPKGTNMSRYGAICYTDMNKSLFQKALEQPNLTEEILSYLDIAGYSYHTKLLTDGGTLSLTKEQVESLMRREALENALKKRTCEEVKKQKRSALTVIHASPVELRQILGTDFSATETPKPVESYLQRIGYQCVCADIGENQFLPCGNAVILSDRSPQSSIAAFCHEIDPQDTFASRVNLRVASNRLNELVETYSGTAEDFLRALQNIRLSVKDSLGENGYRQYIDLINRSGTDKNRFVQEILQNADDCIYPEGTVPTFSLVIDGKKAISSYNETGFTRANIRSITAIGESTKTRIIDSDFETIGKKGVGFKTVFAVAKKVSIFSGEYRFTLSDEEPTIPRAERFAAEPTEGTRMELELKDNTKFPDMTAPQILELCLCLRKLKVIELRGHKIEIYDEEGQRIIKVDGRSHVFKRFVFPFTISDKKTMAERESSGEQVKAEQRIICYVPERNTSADYALYVGLPTRHRMYIPMAIDAPFELTTSREEIETDQTEWNDTVREEMYRAIIKVMHALKNYERAGILRFTRFLNRRQGLTNSYVSEISTSEYINRYPFLDRLRKEPILPTFDYDCFCAAEEHQRHRYPAAVTTLLRKLPPEQYGTAEPARIIDTGLRAGEYANDVKSRIETAFNALACASADPIQSFMILSPHVNTFITDDEFRVDLYEYLKNTAEDYRSRIAEWKIIPVYGRSGGTRYTEWFEDRIFVKKGATASGSDYDILNEAILSKADCEKIFGVNINEMNATWEKQKYEEKLEQVIRGSNIEAIYSWLLREYRSGMLDNYKAWGVLFANRELIPLKNELGKIVDTKLFLCDEPEGYFMVDMIKGLSVHRECKGFAERLKCENLCNIHYQDVDYDEPLTADDVECLKDDYFLNREDLFTGFYEDGNLSDDLIEQYLLWKWIRTVGAPRIDERLPFPEESVKSIQKIQEHVREMLKDPVKIVPVTVQKTEYMGKRSDGRQFSLNSTEARRETLRRYEYEEKRGRSFCQMCGATKSKDLMEVNQIQYMPKYYLPQMRLSLCLECSKRFEHLRQDTDIREKFIADMRSTDIRNVGNAAVKIGEGNETVTFTAVHLAEIQEILRLLSDESR